MTEFKSILEDYKLNHDPNMENQKLKDTLSTLEDTLSNMGDNIRIFKDEIIPDLLEKSKNPIYRSHRKSRRSTLKKRGSTMSKRGSSAQLRRIMMQKYSYEADPILEESKSQLSNSSDFGTNNGLGMSGIKRKEHLMIPPSEKGSSSNRERQLGRINKRMTNLVWDNIDFYKVKNK